MIYVFGNSHSHFFTNSHPGTLCWGENKNEYFSSYSGNFHNPNYRHVLAHKFEERFFPYFIQLINQINFTNIDYIMFAVGEVDCRWHFPKKIKTQNRSIEDVLNEEIEYFFPSFLNLKRNNYQVIGWGVHPSTTKGHNDDVDNPIYADCLFRNEITSKWNNLLSNKCKENDILFMSIFENLIDPAGFTKMEYYMDDYHLTQNSFPFVLNKLKELNIQ